MNKQQVINSYKLLLTDAFSYASSLFVSFLHFSLNNFCASSTEGTLVPFSGSLSVNSDGNLSANPEISSFRLLALSILAMAQPVTDNYNLGLPNIIGSSGGLWHLGQLGQDYMNILLCVVSVQISLVGVGKNFTDKDIDRRYLERYGKGFEKKDGPKQRCYCKKKLL